VLVMFFETKEIWAKTLLLLSNAHISQVSCLWNGLKWLTLGAALGKANQYVYLICLCFYMKHTRSNLQRSCLVMNLGLWSKWNGTQTLQGWGVQAFRTTCCLLTSWNSTFRHWACIILANASLPCIGLVKRGAMQYMVHFRCWANSQVFVVSWIVTPCILAAEYRCYAGE
jgi:hypothetical protein